MSAFKELSTIKILKKIDGKKATIIETKKDSFIFYELKDGRVLCTKNSKETKFVSKDLYNQIMNNTKYLKTTINPK